MSSGKHHPVVQSVSTLSAATTGPNPHYRGCSLDDITQADILILDKPGQPHPMRLLLSTPAPFARFRVVHQRALLVLLLTADMLWRRQAAVVPRSGAAGSVMKRQRL
jgi:hypothetical protein